MIHSFAENLSKPLWSLLKYFFCAPCRPPTAPRQSTKRSLALLGLLLHRPTPLVNSIAQLLFCSCGQACANRRSILRPAPSRSKFCKRHRHPVGLSLPAVHHPCGALSLERSSPCAAPLLSLSLISSALVLQRRVRTVSHSRNHGQASQQWPRRLVKRPLWPRPTRSTPTVSCLLPRTPCCP